MSFYPKVVLLVSVFCFSDEIVAQILDELGLQLRDQLSELPEAKGNIKNSNTKVPVSSKSANDRSSSIDADLQARLDNLRRKYGASFLFSFTIAKRGVQNV